MAKVRRHIAEVTDVEDRMKRTHWIVMGLCASAGLVTAYLLLAGSPAEPTLAAAPPVASAPPPSPLSPPAGGSAAAGKQLLTMQQLFAEGRSKIGDGQQAETAAEATPLDAALETVLAADPVLRRFFELRKKALRTKPEQRDYQDMLADEELIREAQDELLSAYADGEVDQSEELRRLQRIQYLNAALAWKDNPARQAALASVLDVLLADVPLTMGKAAKGSVLGDKFDLYQHLLLSDPDRAEALLVQVRGTRAERALRLAHESAAPAK